MGPELDALRSWSGVGLVDATDFPGYRKRIEERREEIHYGDLRRQSGVNLSCKSTSLDEGRMYPLKTQHCSGNNEIPISPLVSIKLIDNFFVDCYQDLECFGWSKRYPRYFLTFIPS